MSPKCRQIKRGSNPCGSKVSETLSQILALGTLWGVVVRRQVAYPPIPNHPILDPQKQKKIQDLKENFIPLNNPLNLFLPKLKSLELCISSSSRFMQSNTTDSLPVAYSSILATLTCFNDCTDH